MTNRHALDCASHDLEKAELDILLLTIAETIERMGTYQRHVVGKSLLCELSDRFGIDAGWLGLHDRHKTSARAAQILQLVPAIIRARKLRRRSNALDKRMDWLGRAFGLDRVERDGLNILARVELFPEWRSLVESIIRSGHLTLDLLAKMTGHGKGVLDQRFHAGSRLVRAGLIHSDADGDIRVGQFLARLARMRLSRPEALTERLMPEAGPSRLGHHDFAHLGREAELALSLVAARKGASILLYGPPGTGKTEFALHIVRSAGLIPVMAGMTDEHGDEPNRRDRIAHVTLLRELTRGQESHAIIADEADDILHYDWGSDSRNSFSKAWLNAFVDAPGPPTIWIVNDVSSLAETTVRRMDHAVRFDLPPAAVRRRIVGRHARIAGLALTGVQTSALAALPASPAVLETAVTGAATIGGGIEDAQLIGSGLVEALTGSPPPPFSLPAAYDPELARADRDLTDLARRLASSADRSWSLLLHGASGTGKSAFAHYVASAMGLDIQVERGSDLLNPYVGGTERLIAAAFHRAARQKAVLLIDEADDFLSDRRGAVRSWERTMVSEMLRQMESLRAPFIATTNLADRLDPATQRRFTLQAEFKVLDEGRANTQFRRWFGIDPPSAMPLVGLTPGDFAQVSRRAGLLGENGADRLARWLLDEARARGAVKQPLGFRA